MELFQTIGKVERAEIQYEPNGRSKGTGVVQFDSADNAETAICKLASMQDPNMNVAANRLIAKFTGYQYGGRPLGLTFVKYFNPNGEDAMEGTEEAGGLTQDQIM